MKYVKTFENFEQDLFTITKKSLKDVSYYMNQSEFKDSISNLSSEHRWANEDYPFEEIIQFVIDCFSKKEDMVRDVVNGWQAPFKKGMENWRISNWSVIFNTFYRKLYNKDAECVKENPDWSIVTGEEFKKSLKL